MRASSIPRGQRNFPRFARSSFVYYYYTIIMYTAVVVYGTARVRKMFFGRMSPASSQSLFAQTTSATKRLVDPHAIVIKIMMKRYYTRRLHFISHAYITIMTAVAWPTGHDVFDVRSLSLLLAPFEGKINYLPV